MSEVSSSDWSETDNSNTAATPNGWPEGQTPGSINNCARAMMGALKRFWGRIQGEYASTGSSNAYVLTPSVALGAYVTGERYSFRANFANTGSATLNISALGAKTIKKPGSAGAAALAGGEIQSGQPVTVEYDGTDLILVSAAPGVGGKIAQVVNTETGAVATGTTTVPLDDTIPQNTEGDQYLSQAITPTNASSTLIIEAVLHLSHSSAGTPSLIAALFQDSTAGALAVGFVRGPATTAGAQVKIKHKMTAGTTSATTFKVRAGSASVGTTTFNGESGSRYFGGVLASSLTITEILP